MNFHKSFERTVEESVSRSTSLNFPAAFSHLLTSSAIVSSMETSVSWMFSSLSVPPICL